MAIQNHSFSLAADTIHTIVLTEHGSKRYDETGNYSLAVKAVARETCKKGSWSSFIHLLALSSSLQRCIWSVYPMSNMGIRPLFHSLISAKKTGEDIIYIMWTRDGDLDNRPGAFFEPNHFVALIEEPDSTLDDGDDDIYFTIETNVETTDEMPMPIDAKDNTIQTPDVCPGKSDAESRTHIATEDQQKSGTTGERTMPIDVKDNTIQTPDVCPGKSDVESRTHVATEDQQKYGITGERTMPIDVKDTCNTIQTPDVCPGKSAAESSTHVATEEQQTSGTTDERTMPNDVKDNTIQTPDVCPGKGDAESSTHVATEEQQTSGTYTFQTPGVRPGKDDEKNNTYVVLTSDCPGHNTGQNHTSDGSINYSVKEKQPNPESRNPLSVDTARKTEEDKKPVDVTSDARTDCNSIKTTVHDVNSECSVTNHASVRPQRSAENETNQESIFSDGDTCCTDDNVPISELISKFSRQLPTGSKTDTDENTPLATLQARQKRMKVPKKRSSVKNKNTLVQQQVDDNDSDATSIESDEYESDADMENLLDAESSSDESDEIDDTENDMHKDALQWSDKIRKVTEHPFTGPDPGLRRRLSETSTPLDYFFELFPETILEMMQKSTQAYVPIYQANKRKKDPNWTDKFYKPITVEMIRAYLGIRMIMAVDPKSSLSDYWSTNPSLRNERIASIMSRDRFVNIQRYFHINDPLQDPVRLSGEEAESKRKKDPLYKVSPLMEGVRKNSKRLYNLHQQISIDEAMVKCHGQHWGIVGAPNKPAKRGFKIFVLADAVTGYMSDFMVYLRKQKQVGLTQTVVETLVEPIVDRNHIVFIDKFYTSVPLALSLYEKGTYMSGSFNTGRRHWPSDLKVSKSLRRKDDKIRSLKRGESTERQTRDGKLLATVWKDKKHVHNLSTYYNPVYNRRESTVQRKERNTEGSWTRSEFTCPKPIAEFNKYMGGVDRHDHLRSNFSLQRSSTRWWTYFAWFAIDLAVINAFLLHKETHPKAKHKKFHIKVNKNTVKLN